MKLWSEVFSFMFVPGLRVYNDAVEFGIFLKFLGHPNRTD